MLGIFKKLFSQTVATTTATVSSPSTITPTIAAPIIKRTGPTIGIINLSTVVLQFQVQSAAMALQTQIDRDFSPIWGIDATIIVLRSGQQIPAGTWLIYIMDTSDQQGALGYHELSGTNNVPVGRVFAKDDLKYGLSWTVTLSHEVIEMLGDPFIDTTVFVQESDTTGTLYAYELCDAVEDDSLGYKINGVLLSNFVYPTWFEPGQKTGVKFDKCGILKTPFELAKGGYISVFPVNPTTTGWSMITHADGNGKRLNRKLSHTHNRTARRSSKKS